MDLNYKVVGSGEPLIILHGLLGMLDNWLTPAKMMADDFEIYLLDARNHGLSHHSDTFDYESMAGDLADFAREIGLKSFHLLGHSMGGKTAIKFAQTHPDMVRKLVVADIGPKYYPVHHQAILDGLSAVDFDAVSRRGEIDDILKDYVPELGTRQFLLKNVYWKEKGKLGYRFNLESIKSNIENVGEDLTFEDYSGPTLFVRGGNSDYITDFDWPDIRHQFADADMETIEDAGHWLHADQPEAFTKVVVNYLRN